MCQVTATFRDEIVKGGGQCSTLAGHTGKAVWPTLRFLSQYFILVTHIRIRRTDINTH